MKIAMLTDRIELGGGCEHIRQVALALPHHEFVAFGAGGASAALSALPNVALEVRGNGWAAIAPHRPDLVHVHHLRALCALLIGWGRGRLPRLPVVNTLHGMHVRRYDFARFPRTLPGLFRKALEKSLLRQVQANVALTEADARLARSLYGLDNVRVIPNGIDFAALDSAAVDGPTLRARLGLPAERPLYLTLARLDFAKGHAVLIDAIARAQGLLRQRGALFAFVGDGPLRAELGRQVRRAGVGDLVIFAGAIANASRFLGEAEAVIIPSRWEGMPLVLLEAGGRGRAVIASRIAGIEEVVEDGVSGLLFENGNAIDLARCLTAERPREMGERLRARVVRAHGARAMARALDALYRELISRRSA